jgi:crotonobetainyl-CoA:carnitine CoA-transferase CaiB-like acyl-CoA transferase
MRQQPQIAANETLVEYEHSAAGRLRQASHPARFSKTPAFVRTGAPALGADTRDILAELGIEPW